MIYPWGGIEVPVRVEAEYPTFILATVLPHRSTKGFGIYEADNTTETKATTHVQHCASGNADNYPSMHLWQKQQEYCHIRTCRKYNGRTSRLCTIATQ